MPKKSSLWWNPFDQIRASYEQSVYAVRGGRIYLPYLAIIEGLKYSYKYHIKGVKPPQGPGLDVAGSENDVNGFAIYGRVRVSGISVIPP
jgi:hypothetical protein